MCLNEPYITDTSCLNYKITWNARPLIYHTSFFYQGKKIISLSVPLLNQKMKYCENSHTPPQVVHHGPSTTGRGRAWQGKMILPLLFPTGPGPAALLLCAPPPGLPPKTHLNRMDGWCRSLPNPAKGSLHFKIDSIHDVCVGHVSSTPQLAS